MELEPLATITSQPLAQLNEPIDTAATIETDTSLIPVGRMENREEPQGNMFSIQTLGLASSGIPSPDTSSGFPNVSGQQEGKLKVTCYMVFRNTSGGLDMRVGKLDTGAEVNCISEGVVEELGYMHKMQRYDDRPLEPFGGKKAVLVRPLGKIELYWHIKSKTKTYKTTFNVIDKEASSSFDVLLGANEIKEIGFYNVNPSVFVIGTRDREHPNTY
ncbi:hypothetical protein MMC20_006815 [Loxospora ochrophaea]|nr:hypothetical protein [Loxospora ochrophaea]